MLFLPANSIRHTGDKCCDDPVIFLIYRLQKLSLINRKVNILPIHFLLTGDHRMCPAHIDHGICLSCCLACCLDAILDQNRTKCGQCPVFLTCHRLINAAASLRFKIFCKYLMTMNIGAADDPAHLSILCKALTIPDTDPVLLVHIKSAAIPCL